MGQRTMLTIAGFDPSSGAGVTADLAVFAAHGCFGISAVAALTVQSTLGVQGVYPVEAGILEATLECLAADLPPAGIKIGMLASAENVEVAVRFIRHCRELPGSLFVVLDPVMRSSSGRELISKEGVEGMRDLLGLVDWVTPNLDELGLLVGTEVNTREGMEDAVKALQAQFQGLSVVATGGHLEAADDLVASADERLEWLRGERIASRATHGTGCAFSSALACGLAAGLGGVEAARDAKRFVGEAIRRAQPMGGGTGPMDLLWQMRVRKKEE